MIFVEFAFPYIFFLLVLLSFLWFNSLSWMRA